MATVPNQTTPANIAKQAAAKAEQSAQIRDQALLNAKSLAASATATLEQKAQAKRDAFTAEINHTLAVVDAQRAQGQALYATATAVGIKSPDEVTSTNEEFDPEIESDDPSEQEIVVTGQREEPDADQRIRIRPMVAMADSIYGASEDGGSATSVMAPLRATNGVLFPFTPVVTWEHSVNYNQVAPTHANTDYYLYNNTPAVKFSIQGQFSAQTEDHRRFPAPLGTR